MLRRRFDPSRPYRAVKYLRMSDPGQNKRSPEQQDAVIDNCLLRLDNPWKVVKTYRDDGKTARLLRNRPGYQQMLREIKSGAVAAELILVDTVARFGRVDELPEIRRNLFQQYGVLILSAIDWFADPSSPQGRAHAMLEDYHASEDGRIKAHNVLRGKYDSIKLGYWPGGPVPFGYALELVHTELRKCRRIDHHKIVPDAESSWIIEKLFAEAAKPKAFGQTRLAKWLNEQSDIPEKFKPFHAATVGHWLDNRIYYGELVWDQYATGIVADTRVLEANPEEDVIHVPDFCKGIVSKAVWQQVQVMRELRRQRILESRKGKTAGTDDKLISAHVPGLVYKYLLTGLLRCECGLSMTPSSSRAYVTKDGEEKRYTTYVCPGYLAGICKNSRRVPEQWLRKVVITTLRDRSALPLGEAVVSFKRGGGKGCRRCVLHDKGVNHDR